MDRKHYVSGSTLPRKKHERNKGKSEGRVIERRLSGRQSEGTLVLSLNDSRVGRSQQFSVFLI